MIPGAVSAKRLYRIFVRDAGVLCQAETKVDHTRHAARKKAPIGGGRRRKNVNDLTLSGICA